MINIDNTTKNKLKSDTPRTGYKIELFRVTGTLLPSNTLYPSDTLYPLAGGEAEVVIEHDRIVFESVKFHSSLSDGANIKIGKCNASALTFECADVTELYAGDELIITLLVDGAEIPYGAYTISSIKRSADRRFRTITAYDRMTLFDVNVADWYNGLYPDGTGMVSIATMRTSLCNYIGIPVKQTQLEFDHGHLPKKTIEPTEISGREVLEAICEINGVFGVIDNYGQLNFISLDTTNAVEEITVGQRKSLEYEDYTVSKISQLIIRQESNDIGASVGDGDNPYIIQGNFLTYGLTAVELSAMANVIYELVKDFSYVPVQLVCRGLPYLTVGDCIDVKLTNGTSKRTIILNHTLSGIQALNSDIKSNGSERREETYGVSKSIIQLQGKSNTLERTVEGNTLRVTDLESGFTEVSQSWDNLTLTTNSPTGQNYSRLTLKTTTDGQGEITLASADITISGMVTFSSLSTSGQSIINGENITTGVIKSANFQINPATQEIVSGTMIDLSNGAILTKHTKIYGAESMGGVLFTDNAFISGTIQARTGIIGQDSNPWYIGGDNSNAYIYNKKP
ncbi:MAG: hypothetical protein WDA65_02960, partial [Christensenellales bacterium]